MFPDTQLSNACLPNGFNSEQDYQSNSTFYRDNCDLGLGLFANRGILKGEIVFVFGGAIIDFAETKRRGIRECMPIQIEDNTYIDTLPPGTYFNHSCEPNTGIRNDRNLIALRRIMKGEELRFDYSTTMQEESYEMECLCGSKHCRHRVRDFSTLSSEIQKNYLSRKIVMSFIITKLKLDRIS